MATSSSRVTIIEVGPRDGLQNESQTISVETRVEFVSRLLRTGIKRMEAGSFVSPKWVPQMADSDQVAKLLKASIGSSIDGLSFLVPNERGMVDAEKAGVREIAIFTAASETFAKKNINCTIEESFERFTPVAKIAKKSKIRIRGYVSTAFYCPYEGKVNPKGAVRIAERLVKMGAYEVSIGDTIGAANPKDVEDLLKLALKKIPAKKIAMHFHDTRGTALANILQSLKQGIRAFDSSLGGLGGCPYAPGAAGNVATEDVVYMLHGMGFKTGIDLEKLIDVNRWISGLLSKELPSRVAKAGTFRPRI